MISWRWTVYINFIWVSRWPRLAFLLEREEGTNKKIENIGLLCWTGRTRKLGDKTSKNNEHYYMAGSASEQDEANPVFILSARDCPLWSRKSEMLLAKSFGHIINPLLTKPVHSRWLDIGLVLFCVFMDLDFVSVHKNAKKNLANIQPSSPHAWSITHTDIFGKFKTPITKIKAT